jgi:hypothetical protein
MSGIVDNSFFMVSGTCHQALKFIFPSSGILSLFPLLPALVRTYYLPFRKRLHTFFVARINLTNSCFDELELNFSKRLNLSRYTSGDMPTSTRHG